MSHVVRGKSVFKLFLWVWLTTGIGDTSGKMVNRLRTRTAKSDLTITAWVGLLDHFS